MKIGRWWISGLVCLVVLSGCGRDDAESAESPVPVGLDAEEDDSLESRASGAGEAEASETGGTAAGEAGISGIGTSNGTGMASEGETSEAAQAAYRAFLAGDISLFDSEDVSLWGLEDWEDIFLSLGGLEYTCLDLDGDGAEELLVQYAEDPGSYNGVFHYADDRLVVWQFDGTEGSCRDYPLQDGTMVRQYDYSGSSSYTLFRYKNDGGTEELSRLFLREELLDPDSDEPCPYYEVDGEEVDKAEFEERLKTLVTDRMLERGDWTEF